MARRSRFAAWPFLIGRASAQPIQVVAAPRPMCDAQVYGILHQLTAHDNELTTFGHAYWREWRRPDSSSAFHLMVVFQSIQATERFIGGETDRPLLDRNGRPIQLVEGFVCDQMASALYLPGSVLYEVHQRVIDLYRQFWHASIEQPYQMVPTPQLMVEPPITSAHEITEGVVVLHQLDPFVSDTPAFGGLRVTSAHLGEARGLGGGERLTASLTSEPALDVAPPASTQQAGMNAASEHVGTEVNANAEREPTRPQRRKLLPWRR